MLDFLKEFILILLLVKEMICVGRCKDYNLFVNSRLDKNIIIYFFVFFYNEVIIFS